MSGVRRSDGFEDYFCCPVERDFQPDSGCSIEQQKKVPTSGRDFFTKCSKSTEKHHV